MELTLKNYKSVLSGDLLLKSKKGAVRECDEIEKGHYQAYVDENDHTFDTYLVVNTKGEITGHGCDCLATTAFCHHQAALLLFVLKGKRPAAKLNGGKKVDTLETLVHQADPEQLKDWLITLLTENKDLGLRFSYTFSRQDQQYQPQEIRKLTMDAVKSVIKNKRSVDLTQAKKIVELWAVLHEPMVADFCTQIADEECFLRVHAAMEGCEDVQSKFGNFNGRILKYQETILLKILPPLHQLQDEDIWDQVVGYFTARIHGGPYYLRSFYLTFLVKLHQLSSMERKRRLAVDLVAQFIKVDALRFYDGNKYVMTVFDIVTESGLFEDYYFLFQPLRYENAYNIKLIGLLIEHNTLALAEKYCLEQIAGNTNEAYNHDYLGFLAEIYTIEEDEEKLAGVLNEMLPYSWDFSTYLRVEGQLPEGDEKRKWRSRLLTQARREAAYSGKALLFSFQLMDYEQNYLKMLDYLDESATYEVIVQFAEKMVLKNKEKFLRQILYRNDSINDDDLDDDSASLQPLLNELFHILLKQCSFEEMKLLLKEVQKRPLYYRMNRFVAFMAGRLE